MCIISSTPKYVLVDIDDNDDDDNDNKEDNRSEPIEDDIFDENIIHIYETS